MCVYRHNDFPYSLRRYESNQVGDLDIYDLTTVEPWASSSSSHTDINRLRQGKVGAQVSINIKILGQHNMTILCDLLIVLVSLCPVFYAIQGCHLKDVGAD